MEKKYNSMHNACILFLKKFVTEIFETKYFWKVKYYERIVFHLLTMPYFKSILSKLYRKNEKMTNIPVIDSKEVRNTILILCFMSNIIWK